MFRFGLVRPLAVFASAFLLASCSETDISAPTAPKVAAPQAVNQQIGRDWLGGSVNATVNAVWWAKKHNGVVKVSKTIDRLGGIISMPETGLTVVFPAGAVSDRTTITITSDKDYVAYKMEPTGTRFLKDVVVTQLLSATSLSGAPLRTQLYGAYIADDRVSLSGNVPVLELEPSITTFSRTGLPELEVWTIRHFSRYMLASGKR